MNWIQTTIQTTAEGIEPVCARLDAMGLTQLEIVEGAEQIQAFLDENAKYWDYVDQEEVLHGSDVPSVRLYLADNEDGRQTLSQIRVQMDALLKEDVGVDLGSLQVLTENLCDEDWVNNWKQYFKPLNIGEKLLIKPPWETLTEATDRHVIEIEVGLIFGTGQHESTQLCMEQLEKHVQSEDRVLDLGCGSGILSIAALKLGAESACLVDIDSLAKQTVRDNMQMNGLDADRYSVYIGDAAGDEALQQKLGEGYDVVVANIVADVILALCPAAARQAKEGGWFITSGIISERLPEIHAAMQASGFTVVETALRNDWACVVAQKQ